MFGADKRSASGTKIGKAERNTKTGNIAPGPGAYDQWYRTKTGPNIKFGDGKRDGFGRAQTPGPGAYDINSGKGHGITISGHKGKQNFDQTPGPGSYNPDLEGSRARPCSAK